MNPVDACPKNLAEIGNASTRLGCGTDQYGNNQYLCLPNTEKSTLVEFCYKGLMGLQEKGNCLEVSNGVLSTYNCTSFLHGCPDKPVKNHEFYKQVACQAINFEHHCYRLDPACPPEITGKVCDDNVILLACVFGVLILLVVIVIACVYRAMKKRKLKREKRMDTEACDGPLVVDQDTDRQLDVVHREKESTKNMRNSIQTLHMEQTFSGDDLLHRNTAHNLNQDDTDDTARLVDGKAKITNSDQSRQRKYTETSIESCLQPESDGKIDLEQASKEENIAPNSSNILDGIACKRTRHDTETSIESYMKEEVDGESQTSGKKLRG